MFHGPNDVIRSWSDTQIRAKMLADSLPPGSSTKRRKTLSPPATTTASRSPCSMAAEEALAVAEVLPTSPSNHNLPDLSW